jgi:glycosyltransferase involved in cell wall biosynthesis
MRILITGGNGNPLPLVSIITPVYNGAHFLDPLIQSVQEQDYNHIEHIIIDDGSRDGEATIGVLQKYPHLRWWTRPNKGQYATMNEGLAAADGEIVCFICADDIMLPGAASTAVNVLSFHPESGGVYGTYGHINPAGKKLDLFQPMLKMPTRLYPYSLHISHSSFYIRKEMLIRNHLFFSDTLKYVGDYDWIIRILRSNLNIMKVKKTLSMIRIHDQQTSRTSFNAMRKEVLSVQKQLHISPIGASFFRKIWFFINLFNAGKVNGIQSSVMMARERFKIRPGS